MPGVDLSRRLSELNFSRGKRLLNSRDFQNVFDDSRFKVGHAQLLLLATPSSLDHPRLGMVIAKKNVRFAVGRNRIKRAARECFRLQQNQLKGVDVILMARRGIGDLDKAALNKLLDESFRRLRKKVRKAALAAEGAEKCGG